MSPAAYSKAMLLSASSSRLDGVRCLYRVTHDPSSGLQKYGIFKEVVMSAWFKRLMKWWAKLKAIKLLGQPRMSPAAV
eukprot:42118-Eustigmatos_ZCMA.PRE.1